jgi:hypothetical protein
MLDENLPTFFLKPSHDGLKHHESFNLTQHGSEPEPTYALHHLDPASNSAKNIYAVALFDSHNPDILYGEVLAKPGWTQPTLSQEEIRKNGGVPPPPQPILPTEFAVQLYNPDQQVMIRQVTSKWTGSVFYEFNMPQTSFRTPSSSSLDRSLNDPAADASTPKINFVWKKESRLGKDMSCFLTGKSTDPTGKKKSKEPDIAIALFAGMKELTIYETNLYRVDMEDYKGLEVVLLLGAAVIRDLFYTNPKETFHLYDSSGRKNSGPFRARKGSSPMEAPRITPPVVTPQPPPRQAPQSSKAAAVNGLYNQPSRNEAQRHSLPPIRTAANSARPIDPRAQWEIDAETARLKAQVEAEDRERKRQEEMARRRRLKAEEEEARKTKKLLEAEDKERRRRQAEIAKETERLRRKFGDQSSLLPPPPPQQRHSAPLLQAPFQRPSHPAGPARPVNNSPYLQAPGGRNHAAASTNTLMSNGLPKPDQPKLRTGKKSFWGLRSLSDNQSTSTLRKKQSSMF